MTNPRRENPPPRRYKFILNPHPGTRLTKCPMCERKTLVRKFPIVVAVTGGPLFSIHKTCRYCPVCDLLIVHQDELEAQLAIALPEHWPQSAGNPYTVLGTMDRADWKRMRGGVSDQREFTNAVSIFKQVYDLEFRPAHWAPASERD